ncbi:hypothetical protein HO133_010701 [Letharia lupina]|uniref:Uncharacterized protein n=1 Tax=Letharia lupina TaxID=560253 RepID=A0A8H6CIM3_9LECA|nr:uncharacterized protein HO133_010701 [Letharia lupina]KAF6224127.1 hypothetical protein HO133_010701 [Letharia lupina]
MSTLPPSSAATPHPQRPPPPSLFLGPPSRNASNISLPPAAPAPAPSQPRAPLLRSRSARAPDPASATLGRARPQPPQPSQTEGDRTDALWAEMQATLAEVELSAFSSAHVFGSAHSAALDELREAQIALAKVWGRGEANEEEEEEEEEAETIKVKSGQGKEDGKLDGKTDGESEEEEDIAEARRRREANEKFFSRVGKGVVDVVGKLEGVAQAMAKVERESREIWNGSDSVESGSVAT